MILVTVGTTQFPFHSMRDIVKNIAYKSLGREKIMFQHGNTFPIVDAPSVENVPYVSFQQMQKYIEMARIVVCHGGPATIYQVLWTGKIPIVIPRQKKYGEHVSNHQVDFCEYLYKNKLALSFQSAQKYFNSPDKVFPKMSIDSGNSVGVLVKFLDRQMKQ